MNPLKVLELYSGIGGMHFALKESSVPAEIIAAADINTVANTVYKFNFPNIHLIGKNIQSFSADFINKLDIDVILMSPPCQPFTRVGKKRDISDTRSDSLLSLIKILPEINERLKFILLENVRGFEVSEARNLLTEVLKNSFTFLEFILNPTQFGIPNSRERYYLLAKRQPLKFYHHLDKVVTDAAMILNSRTESGIIKDILEFDDNSIEYNKFLVPINVLHKRIKVMDIVTKMSTRSCCFTKAYSRFTEGTGSVYCPLSESIINQINDIKNKADSETHIKLEDLRIRYFTPREISRLMCFPENFKFPEEITLRQKYKLLGNSINVFVVSKLITFMVKNP